MFGSKSNPGKTAANKAGARSASNGTTLIASGTEITGQVAFAGSLEIEGTVRGDVIAAEGSEDAQVRVQNSGEVIGDVCAPVVIVNSSIRGNVYSSRRVELAPGAQVCGDIHYQIIEMMKGAQINGGLVYSGEAQETVAGGIDSTAAVAKEEPESGGSDTVQDNQADIA